MFQRLQTCGLSQDVLMKIWELSDIDTDGNLSQREYYINSHLVSLAQSGAPLPDAVPASLLSLEISSPSTPAPIPAPTPAPTPAVQPPAAYSAAQPQPQPPTSVLQSTGGVDPWIITLDRFITYKQTFDSISQCLPQGTVARAEVVAPILAQSMLPQEILSFIWTLSDVEADGTLSLPEFVVAMHLVTAAVAGLPVPPVLPDVLIQSVLHNVVASTNSGNNPAPAAAPARVEQANFIIPPLPILANPPPKVNPITFQTPNPISLDPIHVDFSAFKLRVAGTEVFSNDHVDPLSDDILIKKYSLDSQVYDAQAVEKEIEKLSSISDSHILQELMASLDKEIANLESQSKQQLEVTVNLSTKLVVAETETKKSTKLRKDNSESLQSAIDSAAQMQAKLDDLEREMTEFLHTLNGLRAAGVPNVRVLEEQTAYAKQETSSCLLAITALTAEHTTLSTLLPALRNRQNPPSLDVNLISGTNASMYTPSAPPTPSSSAAIAPTVLPVQATTTTTVAAPNHGTSAPERKHSSKAESVSKSTKKPRDKEKSDKKARDEPARTKSEKKPREEKDKKEDKEKDSVKGEKHGSIFGRKKDKKAEKFEIEGDEIVEISKSGKREAAKDKEHAKEVKKAKAESKKDIKKEEKDTETKESKKEREKSKKESKEKDSLMSPRRSMFKK